MLDNYLPISLSILVPTPSPLPLSLSRTLFEIYAQPPLYGNSVTTYIYTPTCRSQHLR